MIRKNQNISPTTDNPATDLERKDNNDVISDFVEIYKPAKWSELCKPILTLWQFGGLYVPQSSTFTKFYSILLILIMGANVIRYVPTLRFELSQNVLNIAWITLTFVCQVYFFYISVSGQMQKLFHCLDELESKSFDMGFSMKCIRRIKMSFAIQTVLFFLLFLINDAAGYYSIFVADLLSNMMYPFEHFEKNSLERLIVMIINFVVCVISGFNWTMCICIFSLISDIIKYHFIMFRRSFESNLNDKGKFKKCFLQFWLSFKDHAQVLEIGNDILKLYICFTFLFGMLGMSTLIYILVNFSRCFDTISLMACIYWLLVAAFGVAIILAKGSLLFDKVDDICGVLFEFIPGEMPEDIWRLHQIFVARISKGDMGFSCAGLFVINRETSLTVVGALLTYAVVLIQFGSQGLPVPCNNQNITTTT